MAIVGAIAYVGSARVARATTDVQHLEATLDTLDDVLGRLTDAETGQRGYIITGDTAYLDPYRVALDGLRHDVTSAARLVEQQPGAPPSAAELPRLVQRRLSAIDSTIVLRRTKGFAPAAEVVRTNAGKRSMGRIRETIEQMRSQIRAVRDSALVRQGRVTRSSLLAIVIDTALAFVLALAGRRIITHAPLDARQATASLAAANDALRRTNIALPSSLRQRGPTVHK